MQPKKPRFNPLILALALAAVLMVWSVLGGGSSSGGSSSMVYSTALAEELNDAHGTVCRILPADTAM